MKDKRYNSFQGLTRHESKKIADYYNIPYDKFKNLSRKEKNEYYKKYDKQHYIKIEKTTDFETPYIYDYTLIREFGLSNIDGFTNLDLINGLNFQRSRNIFIFRNENILFCRVGKRIKAVFCNFDKVFSVNIFGIKLANNIDYYLYTALLNSDVVNYFLNVKLKKRPEDNLPRIDKDGLKNIPIPKDLDEDLAEEISQISKQLTNGKLKYERKTKEKLNDLIFDLYDLNILEKDRIRIFFEPKRKVEDKDLEEYKIALKQSIELFFVDEPEIETYQGINLPFGMVITAIYFDKSTKPTGQKTLRYIINKILKENPEEKFIGMREKIYGENCIYIVKDNAYHSWSTIKAFEDGQEILKKLDR